MSPESFTHTESDSVIHARDIVERRPDDAAAWLALGRALTECWQMAAAATALMRATVLAPDLAEAWADLAYVQVVRGQTDAGLASARKATRIRSDLAAPYRVRALSALYLGQIDSAANDVAEATRLDPASVACRTLQAAIWFRGGLHAGGRRLIDAVLRDHPSSAEAFVVRAHMRMAIADPVGASADLDAALERNPRLATAFFARSLAYQAEGRLADALTAIAAARALHPDSDEYLVAHIELLAENAGAQAATALAQDHLRLHPRSRLLRLRLAMLLLDQGDREQALRHIPGVLPQSTAAQAWQALAMTWQAVGRDLECRTCLERALTQSADETAVLMHAQTLIRMGDAASALERLEPLSTVPADVARSEALTALGRHEEAIDVLERLLVKAPDDVLALMRLGVLERGLKRFADADTHLRRAVELAPHEAATHEQLAILFSDQRQYDESFTALLRALQAAPGRLSCRFNLAVMLARQQRWPEAERELRGLVPLLPLNISVRGNYARVLAEQQRHEDAAEVFEDAIAMAPHDPSARLGLLAALAAQRRFDEETRAARQWTDDVPTEPHAWRALAFALGRMNDPAAHAAADRVGPLAPDSALFFETKGVVALALGQPDEAVAWFDKGIVVAPEQSSLLVNRALAVEEVHGVAACVQELRRALAIEPDSHAAQLNLSMVELRLGRFGDGWRRYEARQSALRGPETLWQLKAKTGLRPNLSQASVLVRAEQGLGDTIHFMRYVRRLAADAREVWFQLQDPIVWMAWDLAPNVRVSGYRDPVPVAQCHASLLSLPGYYDTDLSTIPGDVPYIAADAARVDRWRQHLGADGFKVGLVWHTNPMHGNTRRWIPLSALAPLGRIPGVRLISLQKSFGLDQLRDVPGDVTIEMLGDDFDEGPDAFADAAAVIAGLDLVISIDTSMAHIAGAMGRPIWTLLPKSSDWRWMTDRVDTPWYPTMRLFQQKQLLKWDDVSEALRNRLEAVVAGASATIWPVAVEQEGRMHRT